MGIAVTALIASPLLGGRAYAFGGLWSSGARVEQAGAAVIFIDNPDETVTAIVRVDYTDSAAQLAWLIPVPGKPEIALSSNVVFERLQAATAPDYWLEDAIDRDCAPRDSGQPGDAGEELAPPPDDLTMPPPPVVLLERGAIGPYEYVETAVDPALDDPAQAARDWLEANGYEVAGLERDTLDPYLEAGMNLLAFKLSADADARAVRPVMLTYESELPVVPLRPMAASARDDASILVWVFGPSQAVPSNYKSLVLNDALIDWLSAHRFVARTLPAGGAGPFGPEVLLPRNYDALVTAAADEAGGHGFVTELGGPASQYRDKVWSSLDEQTFELLRTQAYGDGIDAVLAANSDFGAWDGYIDALAAAVTLPDGVTIEAFARDPEAYRDAAAVDTDVLFAQIQRDVIDPVAGAAARMHRAPYLTRLYSTMSAGEMTDDPEFVYNPDLAQVSNVHIAQRFVACAPDGERDGAPWQVELPQGGLVVSAGGDDWPIAAGSLPANLKVVELGAHGSGKVVADNSREIGEALAAQAGEHERRGAAFHAPLDGLLIGGDQSVRTRASAGEHARDGGSGDGEDGGGSPDGGDGCRVARAGARTSGALAGALWLLGALALLRRRNGRRRQRRLQLNGRNAFLLIAALAIGCSSGDDEQPAERSDAGAPARPGALTREQLMDPQTCQGCHPIHYREWSSSMHAYAAKDPVFLAMNRRGQRETHGELGDFCVRCHAPMAVIDGRTTDGLNLEELPDQEQGVSCYFCHNAVAIEGDHNAMLRLANDTTMRGPIRDPMAPAAHEAEFSKLFDDGTDNTTALCGGCHDIVMPSGVHLERTFAEYRHGIFSKSATGEPPAFDTCVGCHMPGRDTVAAVVPAGLPQRTVHEHLWPGVDVALTEFPGRDALRSAVEDCQLGTASISFFTLEATPPDLFTFQLETSAGHNQPSGSAQDRRMWLEFAAFDADGKLLEGSSGLIEDGEIEEHPEDHPKHDPQLVMFRDRIYGADGKPVHMFWDAAKSKAHPEGYESNVLPSATTTYIEGKHAVVKQYRASGPDGPPARVTARLRMRPIGLDVLHDLVESGDLDPAIVEQMPTFDFGVRIEWTPEDGWEKPIAAMPASDCQRYRCMLDPSSQDCAERGDQ